MFIIYTRLDTHPVFGNRFLTWASTINNPSKVKTFVSESIWMIPGTLDPNE
jgi:hypothetical protein